MLGQVSALCNLEQSQWCVTCVLTCPGTAGGRSLGHRADWELYAAKAAGELPRTRRYRYRAEETKTQRHTSVLYGRCCIYFTENGNRAKSDAEIQNATSPAAQSRSDSWCSWWRSLRLLSDYQFSACTWNQTTHKSQSAGRRNRKRHFWWLSWREGGAYRKNRYFASVLNLSMLSWKTLRPLVLCGQRGKYVKKYACQINSRL